ncbi:bifunctional acetate--CoA ligase family protein/GNAT family N-acetyltransferase [Desulfatiglans anilini]|uniref:bifunctional acetate--CoA ligase family protein/GNAT family N-acetyltransferase n=1 Tax=Desulfatiglans anilini TaxID=90728 RepID=UPI0012947910|nr:bifunctional acetate--CoA ligase family protein/GNAT family N-acetyltransferase [Desulfatiglans anilini]
MSIFNLEKIFMPSSVAVIGASGKSGSIGEVLLRNLLATPFEGPVFPVNPKYDHLMGLECRPALRDVRQPVDLAVIAVPADQVPEVLDECAEAGVGGAIIISAAGKEAGKDGRSLQNAIREHADAAGIRIIGPNCMGVVSTPAKLNATFAEREHLSGGLAFISQSGAMSAAILDLSARERIGFRYFVSVGSVLDVDVGDLIDYLGNDPGVSAIVLYAETLTALRKFMSAARAVSRVKPIVVLKSGRSASDANGADGPGSRGLAQESAVYDAAFKRAGMLRVKTMDELFDCAELFAKQHNPRGNRLCILMNGDGPGVMAVDALASYGLKPAALEPDTLEALDRLLPPIWSRRNPIDLLGDATPERWKRAAEICLSAREVDALMTVYVPQVHNPSADVAEALVSAFEAKGVSIPLFSVWMGGEGADPGRDTMNRSAFPTYDSPERAVAAFTYALSYARNLEMLQEIPPKFNRALDFDPAAVRAVVQEALKNGGGRLGAVQSKAVLEAYGLPVNPAETVHGADEAALIASRLGFPAAMKIASPDIPHKSDAGGVELNLRTPGEVREAYEQLLSSARAAHPDARIDGVTVQPMLCGRMHELFIGSKTVPDFGPVILFGAGGLLAELYEDYSLALPPLSRLLARRLMEETRIYRVLQGHGRTPPVDLELLEELLIRLAQLVTDFPEISELVINPFMIGPDGGMAVDAHILIKPADRPSPEHLVISPYPNQYEGLISVKGGKRIFVRPIKPEDAPLLTGLFSALSPLSIYFRFFSPLKSLSTKMLARLSQIDYDREMALVAFDPDEEEEKVLAVVRYMAVPRKEEANFAVAVGSPWQGLGIGAALMERLFAIARERGIKKITGEVLAENRQMLGLARRFGFETSRTAENGQYIITLDLSREAGANTAEGMQNLQGGDTAPAKA